MNTRSCGDCDVCCIVPSIDHPDLKKEVNAICPKLDQSKSCNKCKIYDFRPEQCAGFDCSWKLGFGDDTDQPNQNNLLTTIKEFNNGVWIIAIETAPNAITTTGKNIAIDLASKYDLPIIVQSYDSAVDTGDKTIIKNSLLHRATAMTGDFIEWMDADNTIGLYELINPAA
tara:strand:+ start:1713 stop:2225 length:513 start_codon:yes stop_codon:yes gene_type:complete